MLLLVLAPLSPTVAAAAAPAAAPAAAAAAANNNNNNQNSGATTVAAAIMPSAAEAAELSELFFQRFLFFRRHELRIHINRFALHRVRHVVAKMQGRLRPQQQKEQ